MQVFPNPAAAGSTVFFSRPVSIELFGLNGRRLARQPESAFLQLPNLPAGTYVLRTGEGHAAKVLVE